MNNSGNSHIAHKQGRLARTVTRIALAVGIVASATASANEPAASKPTLIEAMRNEVWASCAAERGAAARLLNEQKAGAVSADVAYRAAIDALACVSREWESQAATLVAAAAMVNSFADEVVHAYEACDAAKPKPHVATQACQKEAAVLSCVTPLFKRFQDRENTRPGGPYPVVFRAATSGFYLRKLQMTECALNRAAEIVSNLPATAPK